MKLYDVIVVGGGPVGSYVAYKLAGMGYGVVVLEQKERLGERVCCTGIISQECVSSFGIDDSVILRRVNSARLFSPSGESLRLWRQEPQACVVDRADFDVAMVRRARNKGAEYILNSQVRGIEVNDDGVRVEAAHNEQKSSLEARAVVIAAGFDSKLTAGLAKAGDFVMGAQAEVETSGVDEMEVYLGQEIAPGFFAWLVPTLPRKAVVGLLSRRSPRLYLTRFMSSLEAQGKIVPAEAEPGYRGIPLKPLARTCSQRLMVVGSAAGQVKPTTGGGIYYGLLCADIAADNLHQALKTNILSARSLAGYEREWKKRLGKELRIDYWARKIYEHLNDGQIDKIFGIIKSNGIHETLSGAEDLSFDWHGEALLKLLGHTAVSRAMGMMKIPVKRVF